MTRELQQRLLQHAYRLALNSKDLSTQNGAFVCEADGRAVVEGVNNLPPGVKITAARLDRPLKYKFTEHAERAAIFAAARQGKKLEGLTLVAPWLACADCARAIVLAGIRNCLSHKQAHEKGLLHVRWKEEVETGLTILEEGGVSVTYYDGPIGNTEPVLFNGVHWRP